jgi:Protein of unknown function (DUF3298)/HNH endonuclease
MATRPSIPAELKRQVLVEAGHRCAIQTCKNPDVDIHHIVPWETCQQHEFANLIALCPNCHRRAHLSEIDRQSLLTYKRNLAIQFENHERALEVESTAKVKADWETREIDVRGKIGTFFEVKLLYPHILKEGINFEILNAMLAWEAYQVLMSARLEAVGELSDEDKNEWWAQIPSVNSSSFSISVFTDQILSFRTSIYWYGAGAAHGHGRTIGRSFILEPLEEISLQKLLNGSVPALEAIAKFCERFLVAENASAEKDEWVESGTTADWANFESYYITPVGIVVCFAPYTVGCYAEGEREVPISWRFLRTYVADESPMMRFWLSNLPANS